MTRLIPPPTHSEPADYRGPFDPVRASIRSVARVTGCHRCEETAVPDVVHLVDADGTPLCPDCTRLVGVALRRGLQTLNLIAHAVRRPDVHPAASLVREWHAVLAVARPAEEQLLMDAARLLARHVGYRLPGFRPPEIEGNPRPTARLNRQHDDIPDAEIIEETA
ncbi:hypothetical protein ABZX85_23195 [Streptomyces sp. NPDC004539]|uniref:hypothetical protein n=1 Tax=Streptomyces sp. NPDC004539 TaxID=3154280 RepID=UPI0033B854E9